VQAELDCFHDCTRLRIEFSNDREPHFHEVRGGVDRNLLREMAATAQMLWSDYYVRHYLEEITIPCQRALYGLLAEPRGVEFGMELRAALDSFEHHVLECRGIPTHRDRRRPVYQEVGRMDLAPTGAITQDATYAVRQEMSAWAEEFLEYGFRLRAHTLGGVDVTALQRSMKMLTQAPMVREVERVAPAVHEYGEAFGHRYMRDMMVYGQAFGRVEAGGINWVDPRDVHENPEQRTEREARVAEARQRQQEAETRAEALLRENLSPQQLEQFNRNRKFQVVGSSSGATYELNFVRSMGIYKIENGKRVEQLCFYPRDAGTLGDTVLAQKIMLETDEPAARKIANIWDQRGLPFEPWYRQPPLVTMVCERDYGDSINPWWTPYVWTAAALFTLFATFHPR
jgi:hypothetical protein